MKEKELKIIERKGLENQLRQLQIELCDFIKYVIKYEEESFFTLDCPINEQIKEQYAKMVAILSQFKAHYGFDSKEIKYLIEEYINEQIDGDIE